jgi:hypothetical protein
MKKLAAFIVLLYPAASAFANPVIDPVTGTYFIIVLSSALGVEVALMAIILFFCNMEPVRSFFALLGGQLVVYFVIFQPILSEADSLLVAEAVVVAADSAFIKLLSSFETFQTEDFKGLKWRTALICSAVGNALSYYIGTIIGK